MTPMPASVTQASPLLVLVDGATQATPAVRLASYTATLADRVIVVRYGTRLLVLGKEA